MSSSTGCQGAVDRGMMSGEQHCPDCRSEYVAGVPACADCGGPLQPGPLPEAEESRVERKGATVVPGDAPVGQPDTLFDTMPGMQAEFAARAVTLEGIPCLLECSGIRRLRVPGQEPVEPLAITMPVNIYVPADRLDEVKEIVASLDEGEAVAGQWGPASEPAGAAGHAPRAAEPMRTGPDLPQTVARREGTGLRFLLVVGVGTLLALWFLFSRAP